MSYENEEQLISAIKVCHQDSLLEIMQRYGRLIYYLIGNMLLEPKEKSYIDDCIWRL